MAATALASAAPVAAAATPVPAIAVIVCTHNRYDTLADTLASLERQTLPPERYEVVVVDNSTATAAQQRFWRLNTLAPNHRLLIEPVPGLSRARNIGLRATEAPLVAYIDDDAIAGETWLETLVSVFEEQPEAGVAGGPVEPVWSFPAAEPGWLHPWQRGFLTIVDRGSGRRPLKDGEWLAGTNIAFRRAVLSEIGGFNESLGRIGNSLLSNEELEVSRKFEARGYRSFYDAEAKVLHRVHANRVAQPWFRRRVAWQAISDRMASAEAAKGDELWGRIHDYLKELPPPMRGIRGLFLETPDRELFRKQCAAIEALMTLLMVDGRDPEHDD